MVIHKINNNLKKIKKLNKEADIFFRESKIEIAHTNLKLLQLFSMTASVLFVSYFVFTNIFFPEKSISLKYAIIILVFLLFFNFCQRYETRNGINYRVIEALSILFLFVLSALAVVISVFPHPSDPEVFWSVFIMTIPVMFILKPFYVYLVLGCAEVSFIFLVSKYKAKECVPHDIFISITAFLFSLIITVVVFGLRVRDNNAKAKYFRMSILDSLTGIRNKHSFEEESKRYLHHKGEEGCTLMVIDLDNFKKINDERGHQTGDYVLKKFGEILQYTFRSNDIIGRIGGDEFCVLIKRLNDAKVSKENAEKILKNIGQISDMRITCSIGIAISTDRHMTYEKLFCLADKALYKSKKSGKNKYTIC
ncbi:MAG: GGDEF domain-containing protein [Lachnospiraceae bacterium]|nr:GGDEF domain-containing protein [Lachnospiraceae bacterium]